MNDYDIRQLIKRVNRLKLSEYQSKLVKGIKRWYNHSQSLDSQWVPGGLLFLRGFTVESGDWVTNTHCQIKKF